MNLPKRNTATGEAPLLQWNNGKTEAKANGQTRFISFVGWTSEVGKDHGFDAACRAASVATIEIRHRAGDDGGPVIKEHWHFGDDITVFPLTTGPVAAGIISSMRPDNKEATAEAGIGIRWPEGERSRAAVRAFLPVVLKEGYTGLVQIGANSTMSDRLLGALVDHCSRVCAEAERILGRDVFPAELLLPLMPGDEVTVGKGDKSSNITVFTSGHPKTIDEAYIKTIIRADDVVPLIEAAWYGVQAWARGFAGPRDPQITEIESMRQIGSGPVRQIEGPRPSGGGRSNIERSYVDMREAVDVATATDELESIRLEALDARSAGRITMAQQMAIAEEIEIKAKTAPTFDSIPF